MYSYKYSIPFHEPSSQIDMKFYNCGTEECDPKLGWGPGLKDHYRIHYIKSGKGTLIVDKRTYELSEGQCFLICPDVVTCYKAASDEPWTYYWAAFSGLNSQSYLRRANLSLSNPVISCTSHEKITCCFEQMFEGSAMNASGDIRLLSALYQFLSIIIEDSISDEPERRLTDKDNFYVTKAVKWFEINYSRNLSISEISDLIGLNQKYFSKLFKAELGMSPQNFLIQLRLDKACELLRNPDLSIGEISRSVSYTDQLLFSRVFKKFKGISPREFRKKQMDVL